MKLSTAATVVVGAILATSLLTHVADSGHKDQPISDRATASTDAAAAGVAQRQNVPKPSPRPTSTPLKANPDELTGLVVRFYRDLNSPGKATTTDLGSILSPHFITAHDKDWTQAYGYITGAKVSVDAVHARSVDYTVDYSYLGAKGGKLTWERVGTWYFIHGSAIGWQLDGDDWKSIHITADVMQDGTVYPVHDKVYSDGRHIFEVAGASIAFSSTNKGWQTEVIAMPTPAAADPPSLSDNPSQAAANDDAATPATTVQPTEAGDGCEEVDVSGVYHDGEVLELSDGRHLRVADSDTVTSAVWVAPFDGLICKDGDEFINKDDNETVDLQPSGS